MKNKSDTETQTREEDFDKKLENLEEIISKLSNIIFSLNETEKNSKSRNELINLYMMYVEEKNRLMSEMNLIENINENYIPYDTDPELNKMNEMMYGSKVNKNKEDNVDF